MASVGQWVAGARPRTLPAAIAPVAVGTGVAANLQAAVATRALLALLVAVALQVGVNYANDYSDGIRGTDAQRVGPVRLTGQGLAVPGRVRWAAFCSFGIAALGGLLLVVLTQAWWLLAVGAASIAAAWLYTGGPRPYGYAGLGEVFVFLFFGVVAVCGTAYVQVGSLTWLSLVAAVPVGCLACAILVANNLRDRPRDAEAGKHTLAVRIGDRATRTLYVVLLMAAFLVVATLGLVTPWAWLGLLAAPLGIAPVRRILEGTTGPGLVAVLKDTGTLLLVVGLLLGLGLALGGR